MNNFRLRQISLAGLLAGSSLAIAAEQSPFDNKDFRPDKTTSDCRILEFVCSTCGHGIDEEMWTRDNKLIADIETCEQQRRFKAKQNR